MEEESNGGKRRECEKCEGGGIKIEIGSVDLLMSQSPSSSSCLIPFLLIQVLVSVCITTPFWLMYWIFLFGHMPSLYVFLLFISIP